MINFCFFFGEFHAIFVHKFPVFCFSAWKKLRTGQADAELLGGWAPCRERPENLFY